MSAKSYSCNVPSCILLTSFQTEEALTVEKDKPRSHIHTCKHFLLTHEAHTFARSNGRISFRRLVLKILENLLQHNKLTFIFLYKNEITPKNYCFIKKMKCSSMNMNGIATPPFCD